MLGHPPPGIRCRSRRGGVECYVLAVDAGAQARGCIVLVAHTTAYNVDAFVAACENAGVQAVIASDRCHVLDGVWRWPSDSVMIDFHDPVGAARVIAERLQSGLLPAVRGVVPVGGEAAALVATVAAQRLGLPGNAPAAAEAAANKLLMRLPCAAAADRGDDIRVPPFRAFALDDDLGQIRG